MKILVTGGSVHAKIDAVKFVTNRFKGGLMASLATSLSSAKVQVTYLCSRDSKLPDAAPKQSGKSVDIVYHDGFQDYRAKVMEMAPEFDAVVLGAAVANLIPVRLMQEGKPSIELPLTGKFPSHNYKPGDPIMMVWQIAPRIIDEVKAHMKPGAHLFGFKLLSGVTHEELISAAYGVLLESKATAVFANDANDLNVIHSIGRDRSDRKMLREYLAEEILKMVRDEYYQSNLPAGELPHELKAVALHEMMKGVDLSRMKETPEGFIFGTVAVRHPVPGFGFHTTARGKHELSGVVQVMTVDHENRQVYTVGGKATLNAPLLDFIFKTCPEVHRIIHYHDMEPGLMTFQWAPPGTVRDSIRTQFKKAAKTKTSPSISFNIEAHGCFLLFDKEGKRL
jgi:hypothetical protein